MNELSDAGKKAQAAYMRLWRLKNPDKQRALRMAYWERKGQQMQQEQQLQLETVAEHETK